MRKFQFMLVPQGGPRLYHAETQNSWVGGVARDTHGKKQESDVSESAGIGQNTQFNNQTSGKAKIHTIIDKPTNSLTGNRSIDGEGQYWGETN